MFQQKKPEQALRVEEVPSHIAIIMDGNGRWAEKRGMSRSEGHKKGIETIVQVVESASEASVEQLTLYAFSTENWKRPKSEVETILRLPVEFLKTYLPRLMAENVRLHVIGDIRPLPVYTRQALKYAIDRTKNNDGLQLNFALNYGSRNEMVEAVKELYREVQEGKLSLSELNEEHLSKHLYTSGLEDPDLLIRTGGEKRLSNFLLWQLAYTEFWFSDVLWPDFSNQDFASALEDFGKRKRRYGAV
ncbi:isoprenyl transferase [Halobacillus fulvus]|nr:isoprenyl transferase [Halobacillus fulvus]